jgi:hypothetical protein
MIRYINTTLDCILSGDRWLNRNYKCDYGTIFTNVLLLPARQLGKITALS